MLVWYLVAIIFTHLSMARVSKYFLGPLCRFFIPTHFRKLYCLPFLVIFKLFFNFRSVHQFKDKDQLPSSLSALTNLWNLVIPVFTGKCTDLSDLTLLPFGNVEAAYHMLSYSTIYLFCVEMQPNIWRMLIINFGFLWLWLYFFLWTRVSIWWQKLHCWVDFRLNTCLL